MSEENWSSSAWLTPTVARPEIGREGRPLQCASRAYRSLALTSLALSHRPNRVEHARPSASRSASPRPPGYHVGYQTERSGAN
jgi:hypothetical protein